MQFLLVLHRFQDRVDYWFIANELHTAAANYYGIKTNARQSRYFDHGCWVVALKNYILAQRASIISNFAPFIFHLPHLPSPW